MKTLSVELMVQLKFRATNDVKICRRSLKTVKYTQRVAARENIYWNNVSMIIPPLNIPSTHRACIITVSYFLLLSFRVATITRSFSLAIPIKIGRIPLRSAHDLGLERTYSVMPPTYEKCVEEDEKNQTDKPKDEAGKQSNSSAARPITARPPSYRLFSRPSRQVQNRSTPAETPTSPIRQVQSRSSESETASPSTQSRREHGESSSSSSPIRRSRQAHSQNVEATVGNPSS